MNSNPRHIFWLLALALMSLCACIVWLTPDVEGIRRLIRVTARTSLVFFSLAFVAQALLVLWPSTQTRWLRRHRRQWGWLLVLSHAIHAIGIWALWQADPVLFSQLTSPTTLVTGSVAFVWLALMGLTSFDRTAASLGRTAWGHLHTWGSHYLWLSFLVANAKRAPQNAVYLAPVCMLVAIMALRWWAQRRRSHAPLTALP